MRHFANLLNKLYFTFSHLEKSKVLQEYIRTTPDPDRGYALAVISGNLSLPFFKSNTIVDMLHERVDPVLFNLSYDYVGDLSETAALLWPDTNVKKGMLPHFADMMAELSRLPKDKIKQYIINLLDNSNATERWAIFKLATGNLRIGVSTKFVQQVLAQYGQKDIHLIQQIWHGIDPPYQALFAWLENKSEQPDVSERIYFHPVMLANPLDDEQIAKITPDLFALERKFDGIRVQMVVTQQGKALFSRSGDNISSSFPDVLDVNTGEIVLDGELVIRKNDGIASFNNLQQRLNRKKPGKQLINDNPGHIILYDILSLDKKDLRPLTFIQRREILTKWYQDYLPHNMTISKLIDFNPAERLTDIRENIIQEKNIAVEGLMIKRLDSPYLAGRPVGYWYKWKRDPLLVDAVLMYAQRGTGKRSSYYSDYTFGLWEGDDLLPIGKAYSGFSDEELIRLDKWVSHNIVQSFGPVREVKKKLVFEVAFDAVNLSARHRSGVALRFPRINRIRWDKPAEEADHLDTLKKLLK